MTNMPVGEVDDTQVSVEVGAAIHNLMWRKKMSQRALSKAVGISQASVSAKLRGHVGITIPELMRIAGALDVDPGELLPRLDSNQQPSGYPFALVSGGVSNVVDLAARRVGRAS